ncbi:MAG: hypothetical protein ACHQU0_03415 [Candidatus Paceibacteria bacterium]
MPNTFLISDTHFGHEKTITTFKRADGSPLRLFDSVVEMNQHMVHMWNRTVKDSDTVWHLGDVMWGDYFYLLHVLNGHKKLILGNHDERIKTERWLDVFEDVRGLHEFSDIILTHIPIHPGSLRGSSNVHGHLHSNRVMHESYKYKINPRYLCVSVEHIDYTPVSLDDVRKRLKEQQE